MEAIAILRNYPTSPRKMRLIADLIRGQEVHDALIELEFNVKHTSVPMRKLLLSAISNWKQKNNEQETEGLFIKRIFVDEARSLKRMLPAPQGRAYRIKKRSNHVTIVVDINPAVIKSSSPETTQEEAPTKEVVVKKKPANSAKTEQKTTKKTANQQ